MLFTPMIIDKDSEKAASPTYTISCEKLSLLNRDNNQSESENGLFIPDPIQKREQAYYDSLLNDYKNDEEINQSPVIAKANDDVESPVDIENDNDNNDNESNEEKVDPYDYYKVDEYDEFDPFLHEDPHFNDAITPQSEKQRIDEKVERAPSVVHDYSNLVPDHVTIN
eukprot:UN27248